MKKRVLSFLFIITLFSLTAVSASAVVNDTLKVGIRWGDTALEAANLENAVGSGYEFGYYDEDREFVYLDETDETTITMQASGSGNDVTVTETRSGEVLFQFRDNGYCLGIRPMGRHTETWCKGYKYPGGFEYRCNADGTLTVINVVDIEDYVKGVVPYEMDKDWPLAALEAQAVCARTYAVKTRHPSLGFDVCAGTDCQVYYGRNRATDMTDAAVDNTAGEMIYYGGKPADTVVYCASNGGATEDAANVWSSIPYLVGKKDPYEAKTNIPNYNWSVTYTTDELTWILEQKGYSIGTVKNVYVAEFTPMGNVSKVTFEGSRDSVTVKGETCRTIFYSSTYNKSVKSQRFTINGAGAVSGGIYINDSNTVIRSLEGVSVLSGGGKTVRLDGSASVLSASGTSTVGEGQTPAFSKDGTFTITGSGSGQSCTACVSKKIQDFDRASGFTNLITEPVPVDSLLREKSGVFETEWFQMESKIFVMEIPLLREIKEFPFTAAFFASVIMGVHVFPSTAYLRSVPDHLRIRTDQSVFPPAFQFFSTGSVNYFVFFPVICNPHI